jgi:ribosome-binding protein aMBF1 (putative translation factor)
LTQRGLAKLAKVPLSVVSSIETEQVRPNADILDKLEAVLCDFEAMRRKGVA